MGKRQRPNGTSLAKAPVGVIGLVLRAYGVTALMLGGHSFAQHAPDWVVRRKTWLGLEANGWSGVLFFGAGLLLLFAVPGHWGAKATSLIVGLALSASALVGMAKDHGVPGIFAANHLTELVRAGPAADLEPRPITTTLPLIDADGQRHP